MTCPTGRGKEGRGKAREGGQEAEGEEAEEGSRAAPSARPQERLRHRRRLPLPGTDNHDIQNAKMFP